MAQEDLSYNSTADYWRSIIEPIANKTTTEIGNHETDSSKKL